MPVGFIKSQLEIMELILYILARVVCPVDMGQLTELSLCDEGVDYFRFAEALGKLEETGHVTRDGEQKLVITDKGRNNGKTTEEELPYSVRVRCDRNIDVFNRRMLRERQVRTEIETRLDGSGYTVRLILDDDVSNVMTLEMVAPDRTQADLLCSRYMAMPERLYNVILAELLGE